MISHRKFSSTVAALAMVSASLMMAAPAHAATIAVTASCPGSEFTYSPNNFTAEAGDSISVRNNTTTGMRVQTSSGVFINIGNREIAAGDTKFYTVTSASGGFIEFLDNGVGAGPCMPATAPTRITFTGSGGGGGGGGGGEEVSGAVEVPAPPVYISLTPTDGTICSKSGESGTAGGWLDLPGANDCTPPAAKAGATLLGWATTPDFPVAIAQRQVANGWGTYESFNDAGQITAVFIPAGRATFLSGSNTLYAIWNR